MLVVDAPEPRDALQAHVSESLEPLGVSATVLDVEERSPEHTPATHTLAVYGPDRPGIVAALSRVLADRAVNITELACRPVKEEGKLVYSMLAEVSLPAGTNVAALRTELGAVAKDLGLDVSLEGIGESGRRRSARTGSARKR